MFTENYIIIESFIRINSGKEIKTRVVDFANFIKSRELP